MKGPTLDTTLFLANLIVQSGENRVDRMLGSIFGVELAPWIGEAEIKGFRLMNVSRGGTGESLGLRKDDVILTVCGCPVSRLDVISTMVAICVAREDGEPDGRQNILP